MKINKQDVEIIEVFSDHAVVQEVESGKIFIATADDFDPEDDVGYNDNTGVVFSISYWKELCLQQNQRKKERLAEAKRAQKNKKLHQKKRPRPNLRVVK